MWDEMMSSLLSWEERTRDDEGVPVGPETGDHP
jgi:hypothetical protein